MKERKLTRKEAHFVAEIGDPNITQREAAIRAGFSVKNADSIASRLVKKSQVLEAIEKAREERLQKIGVDKEKVLTRMAQLAFADIRRLYKDDGTMLQPNELPDDIAAALAGVETFEEYQGKGKDHILYGHTKKVRMWDPNVALNNLAKYLGLFPSDKKDDDDDKPKEFNLTNLELSAKIVLLVTLAVQKQKEAEEAQSKLLPNRS